MSNQRTHTAQLVLAALFVSLTAVCAQIQIPLPAIPISLSTLAVYLCGALTGPRYAAASMAAYALLGAVGVPVYAGFAAGPSALFGPSGGYIFGFALCAPAIGLLLRHTGFTLRGLCLSMTAGAALCSLLGAMWFMAVTGTGMGAAFAACVLPFLPGEAAKILLAAMLAQRLKRAMPVNMKRPE